MTQPPSEKLKAWTLSETDQKYLECSTIWIGCSKKRDLSLIFGVDSVTQPLKASEKELTVSKVPNYCQTKSEVIQSFVVIDHGDHGLVDSTSVNVLSA